MSVASTLKRTSGPRLARPTLALLPEIAVPLILGLAVCVPILFLLLSSFNLSGPGKEAVYGLNNWTSAFAERKLWEAIWNSFTLGVARTVIGAVLGVTFAWLIARTDMPGGSTLEFLFRLGFFVPGVAVTLGYILLMDPRYGLLNSTLQSMVPGFPTLNIYSAWGIVWVHVAGGTVSFFVFLLVPLFRRVGASIEEAGRVSGASTLDVMRRITLPILTPGVLAITVLLFVRSLEALEVELILGPQAGILVYSTAVYQYIRANIPDYGKATALGSVFLLLMLALSFAYRSAIAGRDYTTVTGKDFSARPFRLGPWRWFAFGFTVFWLLISQAAPLFFLTMGSFMRRYGFFHIPNTYTTLHWEAIFRDPVFLSSLQNSLIIAFAVAIGGALFYALVAYLLVRGHLRSAPIVDGFLWLPWAVPGILMGLGLLWLFLATPARTLLYGTIFGIIIAMVIRDSPVTSQLLKAGILQIGKELEESAKVSGAQWFTMFWRVLLPLISPAMLTVAVLNFASALRDISTPVLLYNNSSRPMSILMLEYSIGGDLERSSALAVLLLIIISAVSIAGQRLSERYARH